MTDEKLPVPCTRCGGRGWFDAVVNRGGCCEFDSVDCDLCAGTGRISEVLAERIAAGRRRRDDRVARGLTVRQEAARLGITAVQLGQIERGRP